MRFRIVDAGHREQVEVAEIEAGDFRGLVQLGIEPALVAGGSADMRHARRASRDAGKFDGVVQQGVELQA